jgi:sulfate/thiosulfate transport system ATP-binding protein
MYIEVKKLNKSFGDFKASCNVSFDIKKGNLVALLGPSGSGKTTILRMLAGLENPDSGDIFIDGKRVNDIAPGEREIGFVFQNYALFRHMTVFDNIAFGLKIKKIKKTEIISRTNELIELVGLKGLEKRYPHQLSGGQRQRVAFARALAPNPSVLLLDEPFAAIDAKVRKELRTWLKKMIHKLGVTSIFVTHDQEEAIDVADEIIVTNKGQIEQKGAPVEIYKNPFTPFVAHFIGESSVVPNSNIFRGFTDIQKDKKSIIRPEFIEIGRLSEFINPSATDEGIVKQISFHGSNWEILVDVNGCLLTGYRSLEKPALNEGEKVFVLIHRLYLFDDTETKIIENKLKIDPMPIYI